MKHKHHIIPKHMGGSNDSSNLIELTVEEHASAHRILFETYGRHEDFLAWKGLSGMMTKEEIIASMLKEAGRRGSIKGNANRKGKPYNKFKDGNYVNRVGTTGMVWFHNPNDPTQKGCFKETEGPDGWKRGQGRKAVNPGLNFHKKK